MTDHQSDPLDLSTDDVDIDTQSILLAAAHHDVPSLKHLLRTGSANVQDPETGYTPLHTAIASLAPDHEPGQPNGATPAKPSDAELRAAEDTVRLLFENGAIWNDLDVNAETPGDLAWRLDLQPLYALVVEAGVRAEVLLNRLDAFAPLSDSDDDDDEEEEEVEEEEEEEKREDETHDAAQGGPTDAAQGDSTDAAQVDPTDAAQVDPTAAAQADPPAAPADPSTSNPAFLAAPLTVTPSRILDPAANAVMMSWESTIMSRSAALLLPHPGLRVLNIGHGMGLVDDALQTHRPRSHHIVEAHADVLAGMRAPDGWLARHGGRDVVLHAGRWQDVLPALVARGEVFDAIYFDTFAEGYAEFREFFGEQVVGLLAEGGRWSFFHGLGADRRVCYDVYTRVAEMDLWEAGFEVEWEEMAVPDLGAQGEWEGVRRSYFGVGVYRLPVCRFVS